MTQLQKRILKRHPWLFIAALGGTRYARRTHFEYEMEKAVKGESCCFSMSYLYPLIRDFKPDIVVETGVRTGGSTTFILRALHDNQNGKLYSIDLPNPNPSDQEMQLPRGTYTGFYVDQFPELKDRWELILGDSRVELPKLVTRLDYIDVFHHDSDHSYEFMTMEFSIIWPKLRKGGLLLADDVDRNDAFMDFARKVGASATIRGDKGRMTKP